MDSTFYTYETDTNYKLKIQEAGGFIFLHLKLDQWDKTVLRELRVELPKVLSHFLVLGHEAVFVNSQDEKAVRFWNLVKPCFTVVPLDTHEGIMWLGAWLTEEEE